MRICAVCGKKMDSLGLTLDCPVVEYRGGLLVTHGLCNEHFLVEMAIIGATAYDCFEN